MLSFVTFVQMLLTSKLGVNIIKICKENLEWRCFYEKNCSYALTSSPAACSFFAPLSAAPISGCDNSPNYLIGCRALHTHGVGSAGFDGTGSYTQHLETAFSRGGACRTAHAGHLHTSFIGPSSFTYFINFCNIVTNSSLYRPRRFGMPSAKIYGYVVCQQELY